MVLQDGVRAGDPVSSLRGEPVCGGSVPRGLLFDQVVLAAPVPEPPAGPHAAARGGEFRESVRSAVPAAARRLRGAQEEPRAPAVPAGGAHAPVRAARAHLQSVRGEAARGGSDRIRGDQGRHDQTRRGVL